MTVASTSFQTSATGDGVTTAFPFNWRLVEDASVAVYVNQVKKTLGVDYTLSTSNRLTTGLGGIVTFTAAPAAAAAIIIQSESDQLQSNPLTDNQALAPATVQAIVDKLTLLVQSALRKYQSSDQTITAGTLLTLAHSLGKVPDRVNLLLVCQTTDAGYAAGDVIDLHAAGNILTVQRDMTNVYVRFLSVLGTIAVPNKSTFVSANLTLANWKLRVLAG